VKKILRLLIVGLFILSFMLLSFHKIEAADDFSITEHRVTNTGEQQIDQITPSTDGNQIVWFNTDDCNIYLYNVDNQQTIQITNESEQTSASFPKVSGNYVTWMDESTGTLEYYLYNISTEEKSIISMGEGYRAYFAAPPVIEGNFLVLGKEHIVDDSVVDLSIVIYRIAEQTTTVLLSHNSWILDYNIDNEKVVVADNFIDPINDEDQYDQNVEIDLYDIETLERTQITTVRSEKLSPKISGNRIIWKDKRDRATGDIYYYDLEQQSEARITTDEAVLNPSFDIAGDKIVWIDYRDDPSDRFMSDIYLFDISSSIEYPVIESQSDKDKCDIVLLGDDLYRIASTDNRNGNIEEWTGYDIYYTDIEFGESGASDTTAPTFENLPGDSREINIDEGQGVTTNPYIINVRPYDQSGILKVEFYVDDNLICTDLSADEEGIFSCSWNTSVYHSIIKVYAFDQSGNRSSVLERTTTVDPRLYQFEPVTSTILPETGA